MIDFLPKNLAPDAILTIHVRGIDSATLPDETSDGDFQEHPTTTWNVRSSDVLISGDAKSFRCAREWRFSQAGLKEKEDRF